MSRIIDTDNFGGDYPNEHFHLYPMPKEDAEAICKILNKHGGDLSARFYCVVPDDYKLAPGFEP